MNNMTSIDILVNGVRNYLASFHMFADDEWITGFVEYLSEDLSNNPSQNNINNLAKEQWLLNDLKDICPGSLPRNLKDVLKTELKGKFVLQINGTIDIGTSAYQQYMRLQKVNNENIEATITHEEKIPSHRMIKLFLTDGVQEVSAIEYRPMRNLSCDITPGCKVLIKGPVVCRRGVLLLTEGSTELLGGEVEDLAKNTLSALLAQSLHIPDTTQDTGQNIRPNQEIAPNNIHRNTNTSESAIIHAPSFAHPQPNENHYTEQHTSRPVARVTSLQVSNFCDDDIDVDQLAEIEEQYVNKETSNKRLYNEVSVVFDSKNNCGNPEKRLKVNNVHVEPANCPDDYPDEDEEYTSRDDEDYLREIEMDGFENRFQETMKQGNTVNKSIEDTIVPISVPSTSHLKKECSVDNVVYPVSVSSEPFVYIKQILELDEISRIGRVFYIKAQILKLLSKLAVGKDGWSLRCTLVDGTGCIDVDFTSDVLTKLVGCSPTEMTQIKKQMPTSPQLKQKALIALQKAKQSLQVLYCIVELTILEAPQITSLIPFQQAHIDLLKKRLNESKL